MVPLQLLPRRNKQPIHSSLYSATPHTCNLGNVPIDVHLSFGLYFKILSMAPGAGELEVVMIIFHLVLTMDNLDPFELLAPKAWEKPLTTTSSNEYYQLMTRIKEECQKNIAATAIGTHNF
eukprot:103484_1